MNIRITRIPFLLWLTDKKEDFKVDEANQTLISSVGNSSLIKVPLFLVIFLKYIPLGILALFFYYPKNLFEVGITFIALCCISITFFLIRYGIVLKLILLVFCLINIVLVLKYNDYATILATFLTLYFELMLLGVVFYDIYFLKGYKNWYFLTDFKNEVNVKIAEKKEKKFLFFKNKKTGFNLKKSFALKGYFCKIGEAK